MAMGGARRHRVLVVEEDETTREVLGQVLADLGYRAVLAADGREALTLSKLRPLDLVLTGLSLPRLDGIRLIRRLKRHQPHLPVAIISSRAPSDAGSEARLVGAAGFVSKPIDLRALEHTVESLLRRQALAGS